MNDTKTNSMIVSFFLDLRFRVRVWRVRNSIKCRYFGSQFPLYLLLLPGAELPLVESFGLLNDLFPSPSILDAGYPVLDLQLANVLFDVILPSVLGSFL